MKIIESKIAPNPKEAQYWVDLSADANRNVIKSFNGHEWVVINGGISGVNDSTPYVTFDYTQYSSGDTLSDEDAAKLSKAFKEKIPIYIVTGWDETRYGTIVMDAIGNHYTLLYLIYIIDGGSHGLNMKFGQIDFDMNTNTVVSTKSIKIEDYFLSSAFKPYYFYGNINEEVFNEIKSAANLGCNIMWNYKRVNITNVTNNAVYGFIDDGNSITKYEFTKTAVNTIETKEYAFK